MLNPSKISCANSVTPTPILLALNWASLEAAASRRSAMDASIGVIGERVLAKMTSDATGAFCDDADEGAPLTGLEDAAAASAVVFGSTSTLLMHRSFINLNPVGSLLELPPCAAMTALVLWLLGAAAAVAG